MTYPWYAWAILGATVATIGVIWYFVFRRRK